MASGAKRMLLVSGRAFPALAGEGAAGLGSGAPPTNSGILRMLMWAPPPKGASARRIPVVAPFFGYARQDKKNRGREPISARLMADLFATAGADRLIAGDRHPDHVQG